MGIGLDQAVSREHQQSAFDIQYVDRRSVEAREHVAGDDLLDSAESGAALTEIEDAIHRAKERVELVRREQHGDAVGLLDPFHQRDNRLLEMRVEAQKGFVEQEEL